MNGGERRRAEASGEELVRAGMRRSGATLMRLQVQPHSASFPHTIWPCFDHVSIGRRSPDGARVSAGRLTPGFLT